MCLLMGQGANGGSAIYGFVLGQGINWDIVLSPAPVAILIYIYIYQHSYKFLKQTFSLISFYFTYLFHLMYFIFLCKYIKHATNSIKNSYASLNFLSNISSVTCPVKIIIHNNV